MDKSLSIETQLIHAGEPAKRYAGAVNLPIFQSSTFEYTGAQSYHDLKYIRLNNTPNHDALHKKLATLENGEAAVVTASGMAAISSTLLTVLSSGDHLLTQDCLYGGTQSFLDHDFKSFGLSFSRFDADKPETWQHQLQANTKAIYVESMTNPLVDVADLKSVVEFAKANNLISIIDNTFASPINFKPLDIGFDLSVHSGTKYLNGHSDIVAGCIIGKHALIQKITERLNHLGGSMDPHTCFLFHRGLKTLAVRVRYQNESALKIAEYLSQHPKVKQVNYPGLDSHPHYQRAKQLFSGCGGVLSFEIQGDDKAADKLIKTMRLPLEAPSLGGVETLITRPVTTSHAGVAKEDLEQLGVSDKLIRLSVGLEHTDDLIDDLKSALAEI